MIARKIKLVAGLLGKRPKGWQSLLWNSTMAQVRRPGPLMAPVHVSIEPTNACQCALSGVRDRQGGHAAQDRLPR